MPRKVTTKEFIRRSREVHGDKYDYSKSIYKAAKSKLTIICPVHGEFQQQPINHYIGNGCQECGGNKPITLERFVSRATELHKCQYDYSKVKITKGVESVVDIVCPKHGLFKQRLMNHLKGCGCKKCGRGITADKLGHSLEKFIKDARKAHGEKYNYSKVKYVNALTKVKISCPDHGYFMQRPVNHIREVGCPKCGDESTAEKRSKTLAEFVNEARKVHGNKYDYSQADYKCSKTKIQIICKEHGPFWQLPLNHSRGIQSSGCPGCAKSGFDQTKSGMLYYLAVKTDCGRTLYKIGITNLSVKRRFPVLDRLRIRVIKTWNYDIGKDAAERELEILTQYASYKYLGPDVLSGSGNTELFVTDILSLDTDPKEFKAPILRKQKQLSFNLDVA